MTHLLILCTINRTHIVLERYTCEENNTKCFHLLLPLLIWSCAFTLFLNTLSARDSTRDGLIISLEIYFLFLILFQLIWFLIMLSCYFWMYLILFLLDWIMKIVYDRVTNVPEQSLSICYNEKWWRSKTSKRKNLIIGNLFLKFMLSFKIYLQMIFYS